MTDDDALAARGRDKDDGVDGIHVGKHGPAMSLLVEQKCVYGIGTAGEHAKRHVRANEERGQGTRQNTDTRHSRRRLFRHSIYYGRVQSGDLIT